MGVLNRSELITALNRLGKLAAADGQAVELLIVGGRVMVLDLASRQSTRDLDAVVTNAVDRSKVRAYASIVASEMRWPTDWLNDGAKGFLVGDTHPSLLLQSAGIKVSRPSYAQLLAMKLCAWRDDLDIADAARLLTKMPLDKESTWIQIAPHLQLGKELKARYAYDDLWESRT